MVKPSKVGIFMVGDIVKLKSGSPKMTVNAISEVHQEPGALQYETSWFVGSKHNKAWFREGALEASDESDKARTS